MFYTKRVIAVGGTGGELIKLAADLSRGASLAKTASHINGRKTDTNPTGGTHVI